MNRSIFSTACIALVAATGSAAWGQSSVTVNGFIGAAVGKPAGTRDKQVMDDGGSRLMFQAREDLGDGMYSFFQLDHRFSVDTGTQASTSTFWNGASYVGIGGKLGALAIGRQYTASYWLVQNQIDPFYGQTVGQLRDIALRTSGVGKTRVNDSLRYDYYSPSFNAAITYAEPDGTGPDNPLSLAVNAKLGNWWLGLGYENPSNKNDTLATAGLRYKIGDHTLNAGYSWGKTAIDKSFYGFLVGGTLVFGPQELVAAYGNQTVAGDAVNSRVALGYRYNFSKRTLVHTGVVRDTQVALGKTGYDVGIQHKF